MHLILNLQTQKVALPEGIGMTGSNLAWRFSRGSTL